MVSVIEKKGRCGNCYNIVRNSTYSYSRRRPSSLLCVWQEKSKMCERPPKHVQYASGFSGGPGKIRIIQTITADIDSLSLESDSLSFNVTNNTDNNSLCNTVDDSNNNEDSSLRNATGGDYDDFFQRLLEQDNDVHCKGNPLANPYGYLKMSFCEMMEIMKGNATLE